MSHFMAHGKAIEAALRRACYARGGSPAMGGGGTTHGFLASDVPGRTDKLPISVKGGAYVLPADHVAGIGQGNSLAGAAIINRIFKMGPYGTSPSSITPSKANKWRTARTGRAEGGATETPTDIIAAGGEIVIPPEAIIERFGDLDKGHAALDKWILSTRKQHIKTLRNLKPPKKD
jgi:hypothetical protein